MTINHTQLYMLKQIKHVTQKSLTSNNYKVHDNVSDTQLVMYASFKFQLSQP